MYFKNTLISSLTSPKVLALAILSSSIMYTLLISLIFNSIIPLPLVISMICLLYLYLQRPSSVSSTSGNTIGVYKDIVYMTRGRKFIGLKYLIVEDIPYTVLDLNRSETLRYIKNFSSFLASVKPGTEIRLIRGELNVSKFISKLESEVSTLKLIRITDPTNVKAQRRLALLERIRGKILRGEKPIKLYMLIGLRKTSDNLEHLLNELKREAQEISTLISASLGFKIRELHINDLAILIDPKSISTKYSNILLEGDLRALTPLEPYKRPMLNISNGVYLGTDIDTNSSIILDLEKYCSRHMIVVGPTGKGKSTLLAVLALRSMLTLNELNIIVLDFKGDLLYMLKKHHIKVISPVNGDYINILTPPLQISTSTWAALITELLVKALNLKTPEDFLLYNAIMEAYKVKGLTATLQTVSDILYKNNDAYSKSIALKLQTYIDKAITISTLRIPVKSGLYLIDLASLDDRIREVYATVLLLNIFYTLVSEGLSNNLKTLIIIDEAWRLTKAGMSALKRLYKEGRGYGIGVVSSTQNFEDLPIEVLENSGTIVAFGANSRDYAEKVAKHMELTDEEKNRLMWLKTGEAVIKLYDDPRPIWIRIDAEEVLR